MDNPEEIKLKETRIRINNLLSQLSGIITPTMQPIEILQALYKEVDHKLSNDERNQTLELFTEANKQENMNPILKQGTCKGYQFNQFYLNNIELYLRKLLFKYGFFQIEKTESDYRLEEF